MPYIMADTENVIKSGILVKKGNFRHKWKSRCFKLYEDNLSYYYDFNDAVPIGIVALRGASIIYPVTEYTKREGVFMVSPTDGRELLLQAPSSKDREEWIHAISAVVRSLKSYSEMRPISTIEPSATANFSDILLAMQDPDAGVALSTREQDGVEYYSTFTGEDAVSWLLRWAFTSNRREGSKMMGTLMLLAHIQPLHRLTKRKNDVQPELHEEFYDSPTVFYKFSSLNRAGSRDAFNSDSSSEEEEAGGDVSQGKGRVLVEGFLMKKCVNRKMKRGWKTRRFVLRENPATLEYYCTSKNQNTPQRVIDLTEAEVVDMDVPNGDPCLTLPKTKRRQHLICIKVEEGRPMLLQAQDAEEKSKWMKSLSALAFNVAHIPCEAP